MIAILGLTFVSTAVGRTQRKKREKEKWWLVRKKEVDKMNRYSKEGNEKKEMLQRWQKKRFGERKDEEKEV